MKNWVVKKRKSSDIITQLLLNRRIKPKESGDFFNPNFDKDLKDPFKLAGIKKVVNLIKKLRRSKEKIAIWGDYDVDGVTSSALLSETLTKLNIKSYVYIPTRKEGYGLNMAGIERISQKGISTIFSVDCGITSIDEIEYAKTLGMKFIIFDHHIPEKDLPKAYAIINPKLPKCRYPFKDLSACGVVYKLVSALHKTYPKKISEGFVKWSLDLVGISITSDVVPLIEENRVLLKYAMVVIPKTRKIGLSELLDRAGVNRENISTYTLGYQIGPRLNAPGRINDATISYKLLTTKDKKRAVELAKTLDRENRERQKILEKALEQAERKIKKKELEKNKLIFIGDKRWHSGIVGLIAGKLQERYHRPALVFQELDKISKGSARSIRTFHITEALRKCKKYLINCGGHKAAAGFSFKNDNFKKIKKKLENVANTEIKDKDLVEKIKIDAEIFLRDVDLDLVRKLKLFEPTGLGNRRPLFLAKRVEISDIKGVGKDYKHLRMHLKIDHKKILAETEKENLEPVPFTPTLQSIGFDQGHWCERLKKGDRIDIVFSLDEDTWRGNTRVDVKIIDLRKSK